MDSTTRLTNAVLAARFELVQPVGGGGMGFVYRGRDVHTGEDVAVKLMADEAMGLGGADRFAREARALSGLKHPGIVSYVAHGLADDGRAYLVMEWLEGEDLQKTLGRTPLTALESLKLVRRVAHALALVHERGLVHRDIKPSNLFLRDKNADHATLIDFGLVRRVLRSDVITRAGAIVGTPAYMSPEQVRGDDLTPASDLYSLGSVWFQCLTGEPPFDDTMPAVQLAKILFHPPPSLMESRPDLPPELGDVLHKLLAKDPRARFPTAEALLAATEGLDALLARGDAPVSLRSRRARMTTDEQQVVSVLVAMRADQGAPTDDGSGSRSEPALGPGRRDRSEIDALGALYGRRGVRMAWLEGSVVAYVPPGSKSTPADAAVQAAFAARALADRHYAVALCTGRTVLERDFPGGDALDRAGQLLARAVAEKQEGVVLDDLTASLLSARFHITTTNDLIGLGAEKDAVDPTRLVLGKPTVCVGRERELALLTTAYNACLEEREAAALVVLAPPGAGKSRLTAELFRRLAQNETPPTVVVGRCDPWSSGWPHAVLAQIVRHWGGARDTDPPAAQRAAIVDAFRAKVGKGRGLAFLLELCGLPLEADEAASVAAARQDPRALAAHTVRACVEALRASCNAGPLVLLIEDLHFADGPSLDAIDTALRDLAEEPFLVIALGRPEAEASFLRLWSDRKTQMIRLAPLSRKASEKLAREVLGDRASRSTVDLVVERSGGNALFLEELLRASAAGKPEGTPESVLAMLQARLGRLPPDLRQVLRIASVIGDPFDASEIAALWPAGGAGTDALIERCLGLLVGEEILERAPDGSAARGSSPEAAGLLVEAIGATPSVAHARHRFRQALFSEAAYGLLLPHDRVLAHQLAARHLGAQTPTDFARVAEHHRRAGATADAAAALVAAGDAALRMGAIALARTRFWQAVRELDLPFEGQDRGGVAKPQAATEAPPAILRLRADALLRLTETSVYAAPIDEQLARLDKTAALLQAIGSEKESPAEPAAATLSPAALLEDRRRRARETYLRGRVYYQNNQFRDAITTYRGVLPVAEELGDEQIVAAASHAIGQALFVQGHMVKAISFLRRATQLFDPRVAPIDKMRADCFLAGALLCRGDYTDGAALIERWASFAAASGEPSLLALVHYIAIAAYTGIGEWPQVERHARITRSATAETGERQLHLAASFFAGHACAHAAFAARGHEADPTAEGPSAEGPSEAEKLFAEAAALAADLGGEGVLADVFAVHRVEQLVWQGAGDDALARLPALASRLADQGNIAYAGRCHLLWAQALHGRAWAASAASEVREHVERGLGLVESGEAWMLAAALRVQWAEHLAAHGDRDGGAPFAEAAVTLLDGTGCTYWLSRARLLAS